MQGLDLSEKYFQECGVSMIEARFPEYKDKIAAGLVGEGSECFGFDDEISRDHDWGPGFCLWLNRQDYEAIGQELQQELEKLPRDFAGIKARETSDWGGGRIGVFEIGAFYRKFIGINHVPATFNEWRVIPEGNLAVCTNGKVFTDSLGEFSKFRNGLKAFYPEDVRLKKIASRCMTIAQSGQYNFMRSVKRKEYIAAQYAEAKFCGDIISLVFLLNKEYKPFYKWMHRAMKPLPVLGEIIYSLLLEIVTTPEDAPGETLYEKKNRLIEEMCQHVIGEFHKEGLSDCRDGFLLAHGPIIQSKIKDASLRSVDVWVE